LIDNFFTKNRIFLFGVSVVSIDCCKDQYEADNPCLNLYFFCFNPNLFCHGFVTRL